MGLIWISNKIHRLNRLVGMPHAGMTYPGSRGVRPTLDVLGRQGMFCTAAGLQPRVRLDLPPTDCENECVLAIFPQDSDTGIHIARVPGLNRSDGTFDVLVDTFIPCQSGTPLTLRMPAAITYSSCLGDCDADGTVNIVDLVRGVEVALERQDVSACLADDRDGNGAVDIAELVTAVGAALHGCGH